MFAKIFRSMFQGSMYGNPDGIITFMVMLVLAERHGEVDMTAQAMSAITSIPLQTILAGVEYLSRPDPESRTPGAEGRRIELLDPHRTWGWRIVNYEHYRQIRTEEERREYQADWARKARALRNGDGATRNVDNKSTPRRHASTMSTNAEAEADVEAEAKESKRARAARPEALVPRKRCPDDFEITDELREWARQNAPDIDVDRETPAFKDWEFRTARRDWPATWRTWMRRAQSGSRPSGSSHEPVRTWKPGPEDCEPEDPRYAST